MNNRENKSDPGKVKKEENIKSKRILHKYRTNRETTSKMIITMYINELFLL